MQQLSNLNLTVYIFKYLSYNVNIINNLSHQIIYYIFVNRQTNKLLSNKNRFVEIDNEMGNTPTLTAPQKNSKFHKYQLATEFMIIHQAINSQSQDLIPWLSLKQYRKHIYNEAEIFDVELVRVIKDGFCSDACVALLRSEKYTDNIYDQIQKRKQIGRFYDEEQIWYLMLKMIKLAVNIYNKGKKWIIGNVHPKNIFISDSGEVKLICLNSLPYERDHFQTYRAEGIRSAFISPELLGFTFRKEQAYRRFPQCVERQLSQIFTIGMTLLSMCVLQTDLSEIYNLSFYFNDPRQSQLKQNGLVKQTQHCRNKSIHYVHKFDDLVNKQLLESYIKQIQQRYCDLLGTIIKAMLNPNPKSRLNIFSLYEEILLPNEDHILGMELIWLGGQLNSQIYQEQQEYFEQQSQHSGSRSHRY